MDNFSIELTGADLDDADKMVALQEFMDAAADEMDSHITDVAIQLSVSYSYAAAIVYLRSRSRWTQELENQLVAMAHRGEPCPNIFEWPEA